MSEVRTHVCCVHVDRSMGRLLPYEWTTSHIRPLLEGYVSVSVCPYASMSVQVDMKIHRYTDISTYMYVSLQGNARLYVCTSVCLYVGCLYRQTDMQMY